MHTRKELARLAAETALAADPRILEVILYGSVARNEDNPDSDIDLCAVTADHVTSRDIMFDLLGIINTALEADGVEIGHDSGRVHVECFGQKNIRNPDLLFDSTFVRNVIRDGYVLAKREKEMRKI